MSVKIQWNKGDVFMDKIKVMLIVNPCAGKKYGEKLSDRVAELFRAEGAHCDLFLTGHPGDGTKFVLSHGRAYDIIACMGGDGTLNEVLNGVLKAHLNTPLGYIPAGSTNDFARSMHLSKNLEKASKIIAECNTREIDAGLFNDRYFGYVSSFGLFTRTSYSTSQRVKNVLGGKPSYVLHGLTELGRVRAEHMKVETNGKTYEGDYLFGAITNSTSLGGVLKYDPKLVNMGDGMLEMMLIHKPKNPAQLFSILKSLLSKKITNNPYIEFDRSDKFTIFPEARSDWSLDGEFAYATGSSEIRCLQSKIQFICPQDDK